MASVNILCPNGRRQAIKVTPNTTILQILEEVCAKRGFESTKHDLKHRTSTLDLTSTFRFSGIPNNGKLELVERATPRSTVSEVFIALALESGERRQKTCGANTTLADLIRGFQQGDEQLLLEPEGRQPVIVNMREEIIGREALEQTTLQSLGLISGRFILRLVHRVISEDALAQISAKLKKQQKKIEAVKKVDPVKESGVDPVKESGVDPAKESGVDLVKESGVDPVKESAVDPVKELGVNPVKESATTRGLSSQSPPEPMDVSVSEDVAPATNQQPDEKRHRADVEERRLVPEAAESSVRTRPVPKPRTLPPTPAQAVVDFKFPEATAGKDLYRNELSDVQSDEYLPCDREPIVFSLEEQLEESSPSVQDPPDEFFEVTKTDLQKMIRDLREQASKEENAPLMTSSMREAMRESAYSKYQFAVVRFHFPNRLALQAKFRPREPVYSLRKFVQSCLNDSSQTFQLYTTPPKRVFTDFSLTLIQAQLLPMAIVYVGFDNAADMSLSQHILSLTQTKSAADLQANRCLPQQSTAGTTPGANSAGTSSAGTSSAGTSSAGTSSTGTSSAGTSSAGTSSAGTSSATNPNRAGATSRSDRQVPKWYKTPGK